eukprot:gene15029-17777_t
MWNFKICTTGLLTLPVDNSETFFLSYFLSSNSFPQSVSASLEVTIDGALLSYSAGTMVYGDLQRINLATWVNISQQTHTLEFTAKFQVAQGQASPQAHGDDRFQLSSVVIRREPVTAPVQATVYVDVAKGSDRLGFGTLVAPFSTIDMALQWAAPGASILLSPGVYCGLASMMSFDKDITIGSLSNDPTSTILDGQHQLSLFRIVADANAGTMLNVVVNGLTLANAYSSARSPGGGAIFVEGDVVTTVTNSIIVNTTDNSNRGAVSLRGSARLTLTSCTIRNCSSSVTSGYGPAVSMLGFNAFPRLTITDCSFIGNEHSFLVDQTDEFNITDSTFTGASTVTPNLCALMISRVDRAFITGSQVTNNANCALCIIKSSAQITSTLFSDNTLSTGPGGTLYISQNSMVLLDQVTITRANGTSGTALFVMENSVVNITRSSLTNVTTASGATISSSESALYFDRLNMTECSGTFSFYLFFGSVSIVDSSLAHLVGGIWATQTILTLSQSTFDRVAFYPLSENTYVLQNCVVMVDSCEFSRHTTIETTFYLSYTKLTLSNATLHHNNGNFFFQSPESFATIVGGSFSNNNGTLFLMQTASSLQVNGASFTNNLAPQGPILTMYDAAKATFTNTIFTDNIATNGGGGAIYAGSMSTVALTGCSFTNNSAGSGGVIELEDLATLTATDCIFTGNIGKSGGGVVFYIIPPPVIVNSTFVNNFAAYGNDTATPPTSLYLEDNTPFPPQFSSNNTMFSGRVSVRDNNNHVVAMSDAFVSLKVYLQIDGNTIDLASVEQGYASFSNVTLTGKVGESVQVIFLSNDQTLAPFKLAKKVIVDACIPGWAPTASTTQCAVCPPGTYGYDGTHCLVCPQHAFCAGGTSVEPQAGWWFDVREPEAKLYQCPNSNCLGAPGCAQHSSGVLCDTCDTDYYLWGGSCVSCPNTSVIVIFALPIIGILMIFWVQQNDSESGLMTVTVYFIQTIMVMASGVHFSIIAIFNLEIDAAPGLPGGICPGPFGFYARHYLTLASAPFLLTILLASTFIMAIIHRLNLRNHCCRGRGDKPILPPQATDLNSTFASEQFSALIKLILNIYSPIATTAFTMFFCESYGAPPKVLVNNPGVECVGGTYHTALTVSYSLLVVIIGIPSIILCLLLRNRHHLNDHYVQRVYGVFILKYRPSFYFWDVILLLRRLLIVLMSIMPISSTRSFLLVTITLVSVLLQIKYHPFKREEDNQLELTSLTVLFICCVYLDNQLHTTLEQGVVIAGGVVFISHLLYIIYVHHRQTIIEHILHYMHIVTGGRWGRRLLPVSPYITPLDHHHGGFQDDSSLSLKPLLGSSMTPTGYGSIV